MTFADYRVSNFDCKPEISSYERAMKDAGVTDPKMCYLVDDSAANVDAAKVTKMNSFIYYECDIT